MSNFGFRISDFGFQSPILLFLWLVAVGVWGGEPAPPPRPPARVELPLPPMPPLTPPGPPPADPDPLLYRAPGAMADGCLLTLVAEPLPPTLKSGKPTTIKPRPNDVVQAPGDPKPIEGTITEEQEGKVWFRDLKGIAHPKNPLAIAGLAVFQRRAATPQLIVRERSEKCGKDPDAHLALAQDCLDGDLVAEAESELKRAIELEPRQLAARLKLADLYVSQGQLDAEVALHEGALASGADAPEIRERLGRRCLELGLFHLAAEHFAAGRKLAEKGPDPKLAERLLRLEAEARLLGGRGAEAAELLKRLADTAPDGHAANNVQALADLLAGRANAALATLHRLLKSPDPPASARNNLGAILFNSGEWGPALALFEACRKAAPRHTKARANAAIACAALGRAEEAAKLLAAIDPPPAGSLGYQLAAGYVNERLGRQDAAVAAYQQARKLDGGCLYAVAGLGRALLAQGDAAAAAAAFEDARALAPNDPQPLRGLGTCHYKAGRFAAAADAFRSLGAREGAETGDFLRHGMALLHLAGRGKEAAELFDKRLAPGEPSSSYALAASAYVAYGEGAADLAEERLRQARRNMDFPEVAKYAVTALDLLAAVRGEEVTRVRFGAAQLPEGWRASGQGGQAPEVRQGELRFEGAATEAGERAVVCSVRLARAAEKEGGPAFRLARLEAIAHVPLTNDATVGVLLDAGQGTFQFALRTTRQPQLSRRLAWRILKDGTPLSSWTELPGTIALEQLRLGLGPSARAAEAVDLYVNGKPVGEPAPFDALKEAPQEATVGVFAAAEPQQQCLFAIREIELVWKKP
ncbi:MAG: tetratricopeptide repeat protein [Planctomycetes bacterium]|nr:tetratricopeptide repeat protein [Planctomycetota bacterium]